jgi:hypothetical protein
MQFVDQLAQEIRRVDGNHSLGAGALAEKLMPFLEAALAAAPAVAETGPWCQPMDCGKHTPRKFIVRFEDADRGDAVFDNENEAREFFERADTNWNCYLFGSLPRFRSELVPAASPVAQATDGWQDISTAPKDGKHCILAVQEGVFVWSVQGAYDGRQWNAVHRSDVQPLAWMPNVRVPDAFLPWVAAPTPKAEGEQ